MKALDAVPVLNELLRILCRSLPAYLANAKPWAQSEDQQLREALDHLVADEHRYAGLVSEAIAAHGARPNPGQFAMHWMAKHDLSLSFLVREIILYQEQDVAAIEQCATELEEVASLHSLADEILGNARGHLDILKEIVNSKR
jgi:hypothetical protein